MPPREGGDQRFSVEAEEAGGALAAFVRTHVGGSNNEAKRLVSTGKVFVDGVRETDVARRLQPGVVVEVRMAAPRPRDEASEVRIVFEDPHVIVIDKPTAVSSVPYDAREQGTAMDLLRDAWRRQGRPATSQALFVVHRIDKETSGLLAYTKSKSAERALAAQFRDHTIERTYLCVAHGDVHPGRIESRLVDDRGDGLRGSTRFPDQGKRAVTHVRVIEKLGVGAGDGGRARATLCEVQLETGKTHQIRIHLAERGHPLVGEKVYIRDHEEAERPVISSPRLMLHAATLGFAHPVSGEKIALESAVPADFSAVLERLRGSARAAGAGEKKNPDRRKSEKPKKRLPSP